MTGKKGIKIFTIEFSEPAEPAENEGSLLETFEQKINDFLEKNPNGELFLTQSSSNAGPFDHYTRITVMVKY